MLREKLKGFSFLKGKTTAHYHTHHTGASVVSHVLLKAPANVNHFQVRLDGFSRKEENEECTGNRLCEQGTELVTEEVKHGSVVILLYTQWQLEKTKHAVCMSAGVDKLQP